MSLFVGLGGFASAFAEHAYSEIQEPVQDSTPYILRVTTLEVVVDVVAVDAGDRPFRDLSMKDLSILDRAEDGVPIPVSISSFRMVDPASAAKSVDESQTGFRLGGVETCLQRASIHYEVAYHPGDNGHMSGFHEVIIRAHRRGVRLFYRQRYYVGRTAPERASSENWQKKLYKDACSHLAVPASIGMQAARIETGATETVRFSVNIDADALAFISFSDNGRRVQLDYGACNFNAAGAPIGYLTASTDQVLSPVEFARAQAHGFQRLFEIAHSDALAMTRFVVRDRATGNLGLADVVLPTQSAPLPDAELQRKLREALLEKARSRYGAYEPPPDGPIGSFGSVVPGPNTFCADVFELEPETSKLPDFRARDPIGSIYANYLGVPNQIFSATQGIPGVTDRTVWFGMDYHATFWVAKPGHYEFKLMSDDGAMLQIDDTRVINLDGLHMAKEETGHIKLGVGPHRIHVPYYEGTPDAVALVLWVRPPGEEWRVFDLRDFAEPN